jgi:type I restriction enzyme S subunit
MIMEVETIFEFIKNGMNIKQTKEIAGLPVTRIETIASATIDLSRVGYAGVLESDAASFLLEDGDILFSHINSVSHIGKCAIYRQEHGKLVHGMNLLCFRPNQQKLYPKYALYLLRSDDFRNQLRKSIKKAVNQASVSITDIKKIRLNIPPLAEQKRIAAILDKADEIRRKREQTIAKLDQLAQSIFVEMFGDLNINSKNLQFKKLSEICSFSQGIQVDIENQFSKKNNADDVRFLRIIDFTQGNQEYRFIVNPGEKYHLKHNDIAMVRYGATTGFVCTGIEGAIANNLFKFTINDKNFNSTYLCLYLQSHYFQSKLKSLINGAAMPALNFGMLNQFEIPLIKIEVQEILAHQVDSINKNIFFHKQALEITNNLFASLQHQAFTGNL